MRGSTLALVVVLGATPAVAQTGSTAVPPSITLPSVKPAPAPVAGMPVQQGAALGIGLFAGAIAGAGLVGGSVGAIIGGVSGMLIGNWWYATYREDDEI